MVMRPLSRYWAAFFGTCLAAIGALGGSDDVRAQTPDKDGCLRLEIERQALLVLGIDNYFEKGAEWAKANLTVADLNLVKRYLDVYEQLKFRCEEEIDIVEVDEPDDVEDAGDAVSNVPPPPLPERKPAKMGTSAAAQSPRPLNRASISTAGAGKVLTSVKTVPARAAPDR
jgi:hypothetical protein